jgi:hypothetical protein
MEALVTRSVQKILKGCSISFAAGIMQIVGGDYKIEWISTYFDDPTDQIAIQRGIDYFKNGEFN